MLLCWSRCRVIVLEKLPVEAVVTILWVGRSAPGDPGAGLQLPLLTL